MINITNSSRRWIALAALSLVTFLEMLDISILNDALPQMMNDLNCTLPQISWVLTAYVAASAITMPITGLLVFKFSGKRLVMIAAVGFTLFSFLCGCAQHLSILIIFRCAQGFFGALLVPLSQYFIEKIFPPEEHEKALGIWGVSLIVGPIIGPTLAGYILLILSWRWLFFINIPVCIFALLLMRFIPQDNTQAQKIDWIGFLMLALFTGCLQLILDRGHLLDWFKSPLIAIMTTLCVISFIFFIIRGLLIAEKNIIDFKLFLNKNFCICIIIVFLLSIQMLGVSATQPTMLQDLFGYTTLQSGLAQMPGGISCIISMGLCILLQKYVDSRLLCVIGISILGIGNYLTSTLSLQSDELTIIYYNIVRCAGMGFAFLPLLANAFATVHADNLSIAAGIFNYARSIGTSLSISISQIMIANFQQKEWQSMASHVHRYNPNYYWWLAQQKVSSAFTMTHHLSLGIISAQIAKESAMNSFLITYRWTGMISILLIPLVLLTKQAISSAATANNTNHSKKF